MENEGFINKQYTAWCGLCSAWHQLSYNSKSMFKKEIKNYGWKLSQKHGWICPECAAKNAKED